MACKMHNVYIHSVTNSSESSKCSKFSKMLM